MTPAKSKIPRQSHFMAIIVESFKPFVNETTMARRLSLWGVGPRIPLTAAGYDLT